MAEQETGQASNQAQNQSQNRPQNEGQGSALGSRGGSRGGRHRGRGGRNRGQRQNASAQGSSEGRGNAPQAESADATIVTQPTTAPTGPAASTAPESSGASRGRRNRRGIRGGARGQGDQGRGVFTMGLRRQFGGRLTSTEQPTETAQDASLSAAAPEFVPGQPVSQRSTQRLSSTASQFTGRSRNRPRNRKQDRPRQEVPKSTASELWQRIQEDIANWNYECRICTEEVTRKTEVWSCTTCWTVVHLECAHQWWDTSMKVNEESGDRSWRCPGLQAKCYCGRVEKEMQCSKQDDLCDSYDPADDSWFEGSFSCQNACGRTFDCDVHRCETSCHPQDELPAHCPFSPDVVTHCPCGKTPLKELKDHPRQSCEELVPHCERICEKKLECGHLCQSLCHTGDCDSCTHIMEIDCRCGRVTGKTICHEGDIQNPLCFKVCQATRNCGRHRCGEHCCPGEKKASQRLAQQKKQRLGPDSLPVEAEHICVAFCTPLSLAELASLHAQTNASDKLPVAIPLLIISAILMMCHALHARILFRSGVYVVKPLSTTSPAIFKRHIAESSVDRSSLAGFIHVRSFVIAQESVEMPRTAVNRFVESRNCSAITHARTFAMGRLVICNESTACQVKIFVSCPCGNYKQSFKCLTSTSNPTPNRPELRCDEECERLDRNRRLAAALNIDPASHTNDHIPFSDNTLKLYKQMQSWGDAQESQFRVFAADRDEVRLRYEPMRNISRQFLHLLADDFGFESRSEDHDIHRSVLVWKTDKFVSAPTKTLAQCVKIRAAQAAEAAAEAAAAAALRPPSPPILETEPFNALVLTEPRFGLTIEEVNIALAPDLSSLQGFSFKVDFLNEEVLIKATVSYSAFLTPVPMDKSLEALKPRIEQTIRREKLAESVLLCHSDVNGAITRREVPLRAGAGGWSAVAGRAASRPTSSSSTPAPEEAKPGRRLLLGLKKKKQQQPEAGKVWAALDGDVEC
ncbi:hypothetical protein F53441_1403 [Fusarium austroafricanum]|uniref:R3H domain-containing protein n=1 Tax=Fusarium austroafricanum TaxID=2364996 RepID=A0A8H4P413_9HYPO|nr:hypothetical protein F53441_1403 [Fusarium austroafricanum]